jgi:RNA polymerase sigma-70 factor (ECF subfamily)
VSSATSSLTFLDDDSDSLLSRLKEDDRAALAEVYDAHNGVARGLARRFVGDESLAEDLVQEVFLALPGAVQHFEGRSQLRTFVLSMVINRAKHYVRAAARRRAMAERYAREPHGVALDGETEASRSELARLLERALDELPMDQRAAFVLLELEERTSVEVAEILGVPEGTIRTRLFHAKRRLREQLREWGVR